MVVRQATSVKITKPVKAGAVRICDKKIHNGDLS
jgi:hypothetical protein